MNHAHGGILTLRNIVQLDGRGGKPGISPGPESVREIMAAVKSPPMIKQTVYLVLQIPDMHQELILGFLDQLRPFQRNAGLRQEQADHEQGITP